MPLVSLTRSGRNKARSALLPVSRRIILSKHRKVIRRGGDRAFGLVRVYLSLFSFYKLIVVKVVPDLSTLGASYGGLSPGLQSPLPAMVEEPCGSFEILFEMVPDFASRECPKGFSDYLSWSSSPLPTRLSSLATVFGSAGTWARLYLVNTLMPVFLSWFTLIPHSVAFPGTVWRPHRSALVTAESWVRELGDWGVPVREDGPWISKMPFPHQVTEVSPSLQFLVYATSETYKLPPNLLRGRGRDSLPNIPNAPFPKAFLEPCQVGQSNISSEGFTILFTKFYVTSCLQSESAGKGKRFVGTFLSFF